MPHDEHDHLIIQGVKQTLTPIERLHPHIRILKQAGQTERV